MATANGTLAVPEEDGQVTVSAINFGSPETMSRIRSLTGIGAMTRLLHECFAYLRSIHLDLENLLSQRGDLENLLFSLQKSAQVLDILKADSNHMLASISSTCYLVDQVSGKVRELDLAQSCVQSSLSHIDAIVERNNCLEGVKKALESEDYESAANFVKTFLQVDAKYRVSINIHCGKFSSTCC